jgi:DNA-binding HxlR family transcriptional regulator
MQRTSFSDWKCPIARTLDIVGEPWTLLVVRDLAVGISRFDALHRNLGVSRKVLSDRLATLREHGIADRTAYQGNPPRYDYWLTEKGVELALLLLGIQAWGERWVLGDEASPVVMRHDPCGAIVAPRLACSDCGEPLRVEDLTPLPGPESISGPGTSEVRAALARLRALPAPG